jgi:hypothetical protein
MHYTRMRIAHGLEVSDPDPEHSTAKYFHDEAYIQLVNAKQQRGQYKECEVIAALHLISYASFSGGKSDWQSVLAMACDWLSQTGLTTDENPRQFMKTMTDTSRWAVKAIMVSEQAQDLPNALLQMIF